MKPKCPAVNYVRAHLSNDLNKVICRVQLKTRHFPVCCSCKTKTHDRSGAVYFCYDIFFVTNAFVWISYIILSGVYLFFNKSADHVSICNRNQHLRISVRFISQSSGKFAIKQTADCVVK